MFETFAGFSEHYKPRIEEHLYGVLQSQRQIVQQAGPAYFDLCGELETLLLRGGKRLRPLLCLLAYQAYGGDQPTSALQLAVSQELLHGFLLIHDDIIDCDLQRWGGPNISGRYFDRFGKTMSSMRARQLADAQALLAGDSCLTLANQTLLDCGLADGLCLQAMQLQQTIVQQVISGQVSETAYLHQPDIDEQQILNMYAQKTASYSFVLPLQLGALAAGASPAELRQLATFATSIGIAFQLQDDLLGVFGDDRITGKSNQSDLRGGKCTVLIVQARQLAKPVDRQWLDTIIGNDEASDIDMQTAQQIIADCGAQQYVQTLAQDYALKAQQQILQTALSANAQQLLNDLIRQLTNRQA